MEQFQQEGYLRWDCPCEFLDLWASLEHLAQSHKNAGVQFLADTLDAINSKILRHDRAHA